MRILDLSFGGRPAIGFEMTFALASGADFRGVLNHFCEPDPIKGVLGPRLAGKRPKTETETDY